MTKQTKLKTRPTNNDHCFRGLGRKLWLEKARGFAPIVRNSRDGYQIHYQSEKEVLANDNVENADEFAYQNGGIRHPQETTMRPGSFFRFSDSHREKWIGGWWIDADSLSIIRHWAKVQEIPLSIAAQNCLAVPDEWGDCGYLVCADLNVRLKAYVGKGKPATGTVSPFNANRDKTAQRVFMSPEHLEIKQWFVPGDSAILENFFIEFNKIDARTMPRD